MRQEASKTRTELESNVILDRISLRCQWRYVLSHLGDTRGLRGIILDTVLH